jgi:hypothetical protein
MVPGGYAGRVYQSAQRAILIHRDGREELILGINYRIETPKATPGAPATATTPKRLAWVITVPHEPDAYRLADPGIFDEVRRWAAPRLRDPSRRTKSAKDAAKPADNSGLEFGKRRQVGPYDIQPVRAQGAAALEGLNQWLQSEGFPTEDARHMDYFIQKGFTFLCVKISPAKTSKDIAPAATLPPLQLSFKSNQPYYPLLFSSRMGEFALAVHTLTSSPIDFNTSQPSLNKIGYRSIYRKNVAVRTDQLPPMLAKIMKNKGLQSQQTWHLNWIGSPAVNRAVPIRTWSQDVFFAVEATPSNNSALPIGSAPADSESDPVDIWTAVTAMGLLFIVAALILTRRRSTE